MWQLSLCCLTQYSRHWAFSHKTGIELSCQSVLYFFNFKQLSVCPWEIKWSIVWTYELTPHYKFTYTWIAYTYHSHFIPHYGKQPCSQPWARKRTRLFPGLWFLVQHPSLACCFSLMHSEAQQVWHSALLALCQWGSKWLCCKHTEAKLLAGLLMAHNLQ